MPQTAMNATSAPISFVGGPPVFHTGDRDVPRSTQASVWKTGAHPRSMLHRGGRASDRFFRTAFCSSRQSLQMPWVKLDVGRGARK